MTEHTKAIGRSINYKKISGFSSRYEIRKFIDGIDFMLHTLDKLGLGDDYESWEWFDARRDLIEDVSIYICRRSRSCRHERVKKPSINTESNNV